MKEKGFTFIELVIVILLIGILTAAIGPRILHLQDSFKVEAAAEQIANHIRLAQSRAIAEHPSTGTEKFGVGFDIKPANLYSVYDQDGEAVTNPLKGGSYSLWGIDFDTDEQLKGVAIDDTTLIEHQVDFDALGRPSSGGKVTISKGSSICYIGVAAETGAISIW
ncbi:type II secretion system protein [bacterium]|nr:type II secretion system protein [bacterium]